MSDSSSSTTPMMQQYHAIRSKLPADVLLLFRLGDFYEMFFEDANVASGILNLALTKRQNIPMCGLPYHAAESYISRLIRAGKRVAIAEQTTEPQPGKLVKRELTTVITAGTVDNINMLDAARPHFLVALCQHGKVWGLAWADHTTGRFTVAEFDREETVADELARLSPAELIYPEEQATALHGLLRGIKALQPVDGYAFLPDQALYLLKDHFKVQSLDGFGCANLTAAVGAAGAILFYLRDQLHRSVTHLSSLQTYQNAAHVLLDSATQQHLELVHCRAGKAHTLLAAIDRTRTPMGARLMRHWLLHPLRDLAEINARQDMIQSLMEASQLLADVRECLGSVRDMERTLGRLSQGTGNARDMRVLAQSLQALPGLRTSLDKLAAGTTQLVPAPAPEMAGRLAEKMPDFTALAEELQRALVDEPPALVKDGGIFRDAYLPDLDELRCAGTEGKQWMASLQEKEIARTGIKSLKIRYNSVFGYYIEITKSNLASVPKDYQRKQTTATGERFFTPELKDMEHKILGAEERAKALEYEAFLALREEVLAQVMEIQTAASAVGSLDALAGLAETARLYNYQRPVLNQTRNLNIRDGRHPVLDQQNGAERFVPNDTTMEPEANRLLLITGPNMAGKSTFIRQVALLTLLAHVGSFIPAASAEIGLVDRIFTRVGANDDLARGQSTFMVEMNETALIVNHATAESLIILDEIGRGTSTFDGLSLAWSIAEHLHDLVGARTLFATHYHEMTALANSRAGVKNYSIAVREWNEQVIFLRKIIPGAADRSYGIQVARLAGLPDSIIQRAKAILSSLENGNPVVASAAPPPKGRSARVKETSADESPQMTLTLFG